MARDAKPWFRSQTGWWMAVVGGVRHKLAKGKDAKAEAKKRLREILSLKEASPAPDSRDLTVPGVIELYLEHAKRSYAPRSLYERRLILQAFAEAHGFQKANDLDCSPHHFTAWLDANERWKSD